MNVDKKQKEEQIRKLRAVSQFLKWDDWSVVKDILKDARTNFVRWILANTQTEDKEFTLNDMNKTEIKSINRILNLANIIDMKLEWEEMELSKLMEEEPELEIGDEDEIFSTVDS